VTLDNTDGTTYTSMSASIFVDNIGLADFAVAEVKHPVTGAWIGLTPVVDGTGLRLNIGPTSNYEVGPERKCYLDLPRRVQHSWRIRSDWHVILP